MENKSFLIDTQVFVWWMEKSKWLRQDLFGLLNNPENQIFLSVASIWEIVIKKARKKLKIKQNIVEGIKISGFQTLPIDITHVLKVEELPLYHHDPFDRILIAQAKVENLTLITSDQKFQKYKLDLIRV